MATHAYANCSPFPVVFDPRMILCEVVRGQETAPDSSRSARTRVMDLGGPDRFPAPTAPIAPSWGRELGFREQRPGLVKSTRAGRAAGEARVGQANNELGPAICPSLNSCIRERGCWEETTRPWEGEGGFLRPRPAPAGRRFRPKLRVSRVSRPTRRPLSGAVSASCKLYYSSIRRQKCLANLGAASGGRGGLRTRRPSPASASPSCSVDGSPSWTRRWRWQWHTLFTPYQQSAYLSPIPHRKRLTRARDLGFEAAALSESIKGPLAETLTLDSATECAACQLSYREPYIKITHRLIFAIEQL